MNTDDISVKFYKYLEEGDLSAIKDIIETNPELLATEDSKGCNPMIVAISKQHEDIVSYFLHNDLVKKFINFYSKDVHGQGIIHYATYQNNMKILDEILSVVKVDLINEPFPYHMNVLSRGLLNENIELIKYLFDNHDLNSLAFQFDAFRGNSFHYLFKTANIELISYFFEQLEDDILLKNQEIITRFLKEAANNKNDVIPFLLNLKIRDQFLFSDVNELFIECILSEKRDILKFLLTNDISQNLDLTYKNRDGISALIACAYINDIETLKYLLTFSELNNDKELFWINEKGINALIASLRYKNTEITNYLIDNYHFENDEKTLTQLQLLVKHRFPEHAYLNGLSLLQAKQKVNTLEKELPTTTTKVIKNKI